MKSFRSYVARRFLTLALLLMICGLSSFSVQAQVAPPTITAVTPPGAERGKTITLTIEGNNLSNADRIFFSDPKLEGKITSSTELGPEKRERAKGATAPPINDIAVMYRLTAEVKIDPKTPTGRHTFRIKTSRGTTTAGVLAVGALPEVGEAEPNNNVQKAQKVLLPSTAAGLIEMMGDADVYEFEATKNQHVVFEIVAASVGSTLDAELELLDAQGRNIARNNDFRGRTDSLLMHRFADAGKYFIRVTDTLGRAGKRNFYRLNMGELPYITNVFPLGLQQGTQAELNLIGVNLDASSKVKVKASDAESSASSPLWSARTPITIKPDKGEPLNRMRVAVGAYPEVMEQASNDDLQTAQPLQFPVTVNGRIAPSSGNGASSPDTDVFKVAMRKNQNIVFSVAAQRLGSSLDSIIEVLDAKGQLIPRVIARPVLETFTTLRDHTSEARGIRVQSVNGIGVGDFMMIGGELIRVEDLPKSPDADVLFFGTRNQRIAFEGTTSEAHALDSSFFKVTLHKPGEDLPSSGMKPVTFHYRNDDGGPSYGKDSYLSFTAPADGDYYLRLKDVRDQGGEDYAYRLTIADAKPDFTLTITPANPNVPVGGSTALNVIATRIEGFDDPVEVRVENLPEGMQATTGTILPNHFSTLLTLTCPVNSKCNDSIAGVPLKVVGKAIIAGKEVARAAETDDMVGVISVAAAPELTVAVDGKELTVEPGGVAEVTVDIERHHGFAGRVPIDVRNLPFGVSVPDTGLNGVMITENETSRKFKIKVHPKTEALEQQIYVVGRIETNAGVPYEHAATPIKLKITRKQPDVAQQTSPPSTKPPSSGAQNK